MIGELLPDQPKLDNPGVVQAVNVTPYANGYRPVRQLEALTTGLLDVCRGAAMLHDAEGVTYGYAGDDTKVYVRAGTDWTALATDYTLGAKDRWEFGRWYDKVLAVNGVDRVQYGDFSAALTDAAIDAPIGKHMNTARNYVMVGNLTANAAGDADAAGVAWCALGDPTDWTGSDSGYQHLDGAGTITKVLGGEYFTICMTGGIFRAQAVGPPAHFQFDLVAPSKPVPYSGAIVQVGYLVFFLSYDGFYSFDGNTAIPISSGKMARTFFNDFDVNAAHLMTSAVDLENNLVWFAYPGRGHNGVNSNRAYVYNYETGIWTGPIEQSTQQLMYTLTPAVTSDEIPPGDENCDDYTTTYCDDVQYLGGSDPVLGAFIPGNVYAVPTGAILKALIETGEYAHNRGGFAMVTGFRPYVDGDNPTVRARMCYRDKTSGPSNGCDFALINPRTGSLDHRASARYHSYTVEVTGDYSSISGGEPILVPGGAR